VSRIASTSAGFAVVKRAAISAAEELALAASPGGTVFLAGRATWYAVAEGGPMRIAEAAALLVAGLVFIAVRVAAAQDPRVAEAEQAFEQAEEAYNTERWHQAAELYARSHELLTAANHPRRGWVNFNIGRAWEHLPGREGDALRAYEAFLSETPEDPNDAELSQQRAQARTRIAELRARGVGTGGISPVGPILIGAGGAILIAGVATGIAALLQQGDLLAACDDATCPSTQRDAWSQVEALAIATDVLIPLSVVAIGVGVVLMLVLNERDGGTAMCGPEGCTLGGRF
jgi:hypothetical protein